MLRRSALIVSTALVLALPSGVALAATDDVDDRPTPSVTCPQYEERLELRQEAGLPDCPFAEDGVAVNAMAQQRLQLRDQAECTGDGPHGQGPRDGSGPLHEGPMDGTGNRFGHADR